jgi:small subunit ribosomal protein S20
VANHKQAIKRNRQRDHRHLRNRVTLGSMRTALKRARAAIDANEGNASELVKKAVSAIDKAVTKGAVKRSTASRLVSRLTRRTA